MLKVDNFETYGWQSAIRGMRNPMNSWSKSDSGMQYNIADDARNFVIGANDMDLAERLRNGGADDRKFMRQIFVSCDITAPLYWWKEMDQYKVATTTNSCSTMHKITEKPFVIEDFSADHLMHINECHETELLDLGDGDNVYDYDYLYSPDGIMKIVIDELNMFRNLYLKTDDPDLKKKYWWQMIQLLPSSYNQKRTWTANYEVLANIYRARHAHKLDEWHVFCEAIEKLPYAKQLIIGKKDEKLG